MESQPSFASLGRVAAIEKLYAESPFKGARNGSFACKNGRIESVSRLLTEGIDFDLSYFPFKHLGYKSVVEATAMLYARFAMPRCLNINLAVSAKLDFAQIQQLWEGICLAAKDYAYESVSLDIAASLNGLCMALSADGFIKDLGAKRRPAPKSKDLLCLSGNVGGAFLGLQILQREKSQLTKKMAGQAGYNGKGADGVTPGMLAVERGVVVYAHRDSLIVQITQKSDDLTLANALRAVLEEEGFSPVLSDMGRVTQNVLELETLK